MSDYKENTVGWWLSKLKEPLRSMANESLIQRMPETSEKAHELKRMMHYACQSLVEAFDVVFPHLSKEMKPFFEGSRDFHAGAKHPDPNKNSVAYCNGWDMARECAPDPKPLVIIPPLTPEQILGLKENPILLESPAPGKMKTMQQWLDMLKMPLAGEWMPPKPRGPFTNNLDAPCHSLAMAITQCDWGYNDRYTYWCGVMNYFDGATRTKTCNERQRGWDDAEKSAPDGYDPQAERNGMGGGKINNETIEGRHDREIKELQARVAQLEEKLFNYLGIRVDRHGSK